MACSCYVSGHRQILFTNKNIFDIEESFNHQNDCVYASSTQEAKEKKNACIIWLPWFGGVSTMEAAQIHFCKKGVKTKAKVYQDAILVPIM